MKHTDICLLVEKKESFQHQHQEECRPIDLFPFFSSMPVLEFGAQMMRWQKEYSLKIGNLDYT